MHARTVIRVLRVNLVFCFVTCSSSNFRSFWEDPVNFIFVILEPTLVFTKKGYMNHCYNFVSIFFTTKCRCFIEIKRLFSKMAWRAAIRLAKKGDTRNQTLTEISRVCDRIFLVYLEARVLFSSDQICSVFF